MKASWKAMYAQAMLVVAGILGMLRFRKQGDWQFWLPLLLFVLAGSALLSTGRLAWQQSRQRANGPEKACDVS